MLHGWATSINMFAYTVAWEQVWRQGAGLGKNWLIINSLCIHLVQYALNMVFVVESTQKNLLAIL